MKLENRHAEAYQYARLIWKPKKLQRVIYQGRRYRIEKVTRGKGVKLVGRAGYLYAGQVLWRPTPKDFNAVLDLLQDIWVYRELIAGDRQKTGIKCHTRVIPLQGRAVHILSQVLNLRSVDSGLSVTINRVFEDAYQTPKGPGSDVRIHYINTTEDRDPA